ncbi:MAG TPA: PEP-CTERM sorting domain-containing protein [Chthoniobacteraceae bacterium]|jgi:hypothetical protein
MIPILKRSIVGASLLLTAVASASAATLAVDINNSTPSATQSGFVGYTANAASELSTTFSYADTQNGTLTFVVTGLSGDNNRDRGTGNLGGVTNADLYRDILFDNANQTGADAFDITFSGLLANSAYTFKFYAFDAGNPTNGNTNTFTLNTAGATFGGVNGTSYDTAGAAAVAGPNGNSVTNSGNPTSNDQYAVVLTGTTNSSGNIGFTQTGSAFPTLNGFVITPVPEPSALMAVLSGGGVLLGLRRRRAVTA